MTSFHRSAAEALAGHVRDGMTIAVGGFGLCGNPFDLIEALRDSEAQNLTIVSNNMGVDGKGLGLLLESRQVAKVIASYVGENALFAQQYLDGVLDVEFTPQGTLAERLRAGGAGIAAFYTRTGAGTPVADGKPTADFDGETYVLERAVTADISLVHAHRADRAGNLTYRHTAQNFNPLVATAGRTTFVEAENVVESTFIEPNEVTTPGIFVDHVAPTSGHRKEIEQRTVRPRTLTSTEA